MVLDRKAAFFGNLSSKRWIDACCWMRSWSMNLRDDVDEYDGCEGIRGWGAESSSGQKRGL